MSEFKLSVEALFDGKNIVNQQTIVIKDGIISEISSANKDSTNSEILAGLLVPGYIDIQVNGGGGYLFNQTPDLNTIKNIGRAHQAFGTTGWLPTLVTDSIEKMHQAADAVAAARENNLAGVLGIHFEGPHLSSTKKGVHVEQFIRSMSGDEKEIYSRKDLGKIVVTLAPESVSPDLITELVGSGVIVCLGHSNASFEQTMIALNAGARGFTHLFNAMSAFTSREPGMVGAALLDQKSYSGLIMDGFHVHPDTARLAINMNKNIMLVTDAMPPVGAEQDSFDFFGQQITRVNNQLKDNQGRLAGSVLEMNTAVNNCVEMLGLSHGQAINMASQKPAEFLGLNDQYGSLEIGKKASMLLLDKSGFVAANWIDGKQIF